MKDRNRILLIVFGCGASSMAIEMTASRMISNVYSGVNVVWAAIIGSILIYLAVGNWLGSRYMAKHSTLPNLARLVLLAGVLTCLIPVIARPLLGLAAVKIPQVNIPVVSVIFIGVLLTLSLPMILLGMITPAALTLIRIAEPQKEGAGILLAASTTGSFLGTLLPIFFLIPQFGSTRTFLIIGSFLILLSVVGLSTKKQLGTHLLLLLLALLLLIFFPAKPLNSNQDLLSVESTYQLVRVQQENGFTILCLNEGQGIQSIYHPEIENYYGPWEQILTAPFFFSVSDSLPEVKNVAILGFAGGTAARQLVKVFPEVGIDGFEIDGEVVDAAHRFFDLPEENLTLQTNDGRIGLLQSNTEYDIVMVDAFNAHYIPANLCTQEFFRIVSSKLSQRGVMLMNIGGTSENHPLVDAILRTAASVFESVFTLQIPDSYNYVLYAMNFPSSVEIIEQNYANFSQSERYPSLLKETLSIAVNGLTKPEIPSGILLTDDHAPVERLADLTLFNAIRSYP
ncbi:MAG: fused MFS/spermidine synthase [Chloroflexi bacterium]|nr:fused MFS/spermidine synthase [Chloroflexota bacterium]